MSIDHVILIGAANSAKTMLAREAARWLDAEHDMGEAAYIARIAERAAPNVLHPPFRAPHHTCSAVALTGRVVNGWRWQPGELSLAHGGVLFLDELPEFGRAALLAAAHAMRTQRIEYADRHGVSLVVPCRFRLIAAMNGCPCGKRRADNKPDDCRCTEQQVQRYVFDRVPAELRGQCRFVPVHGRRQLDGRPLTEVKG